MAISRFGKTVSVPYSADQVFDLISDVKRYPEFIKWIAALDTREVESVEGGERCLALARVGFKGFSERFSTRVTAKREEGLVVSQLVDGPFKHLEARWRVKPGKSDGDSDVRLEIDYEFKSRLIDLFARANMDMAADRIFKAFLDEAARRYGPGFV
jgi:coenzyme Q-binding protein COQ10